MTLHSLDPVETAPPSDSVPGTDEPYILVFGNSYDHKLVDPTLATLSDAFPYANIVALGGSVAPTPRVRLMKSGAIPPGAAAPRWRDCAHRLVDLIHDMAAGSDGQGWVRREAVIEVCGGSRAS
ncbi:hypothetical protein FHS55_000068 [Angulomicrobium tetraedrale]|uniref:Uncharacterized protein n=1 Tax=Ancylobacter tetraedralis TaxID=217068 RepID=A0A839Z1D5_9HYPH|nr:hypothetical protein [Ancylobacter tetraedralis]MBB3769482.1 hypothetical protein [Ancylobacter tetraedralis]